MHNRVPTTDRQELESACTSLFGGHVTPGRRATEIILSAWEKHSLLRFGASISLKTNLAVFRTVLANSPACANILSRHNLDIRRVFSPTAADENQLKELRIREYRGLLSEVFTERLFSGGGLNQSGELVRSTGLLTEVDMFAACLESGRLQLLPTPTVEALLGKDLALINAGFVTEEGDRVLEHIEAEARRIALVDPSHSSQQFLLFLDDNGKFRIRPFGATALGTLDESNMPHGPFIFRGNTFQVSRVHPDFTSDVLTELESLINSAVVTEHDFQAFFEKHPRLLAGLDFGTVHPHPILHRDEGGNLVPDFFLEKMDVGASALLDLKTPSQNLVVRRPNRVYFSQFVQNAIAQLQFYREWFEDHGNRSQIERTLGLSQRVFRPRLVLVAGRASHFQNEVERVRLVSNQRDEVDIWTFDDVLARARRYQEFLRGDVRTGQSDEQAPGTRR